MRSLLRRAGLLTGSKSPQPATPLPAIAARAGRTRLHRAPCGTALEVLEWDAEGHSEPTVVENGDATVHRRAEPAPGPSSSRRRGRSAAPAGGSGITGVQGAGAVPAPRALSSSAAAPASTHIIFFPGNPGSVAFYTDFGAALAAAGGGAWRLSIVGHAGHSARVPTRKVYSLAEQVTHKVEYVKTVLASDPTSRIVVAGHSVGAYLAMQVVQALLSESEETAGRLAAGVLLFPTVANIGATRNALRLRTLFKPAVRATVGVAVALLACLPRRLRRAIAASGLEDGASPASLDGAEALVRGYVARNVLGMAAQEMRQICAVHGPTFASVQGSLLAVWGEDDAWVNDSDVVHLRTSYPGMSMLHCRQDGAAPGGAEPVAVSAAPAALHAMASGGGGAALLQETHKHAFCLSLWSSQRVAAVVSAWLHAKLGTGLVVQG